MILAFCRISMDLRISMRSFPELVRLIWTIEGLAPMCISSQLECRACFLSRMHEFGPSVTSSEAWIVDR